MSNKQNIVRALEAEETAAKNKADKKKRLRKSSQKADRLRSERSGKEK